MNKNTKILNEITEYFKNNDSSKAVNAITTILKAITIRKSSIGTEKMHNCKMTFLDTLKLVILFPFFSIKNPKNFEGSFLSKLFSVDIKMFYRFMDDENVTWRNILYSINKQLISFCKNDNNPSNEPKVLILDDTDLPKTGRKAEGLGRVFSHVDMKSILGFKSLFLCYSDGKTQFMLDNTIQAEKGKDPDKPQGMTKKQKNEQYEKTRDSESEAQKRKEEMFESKIKNSIMMIKKAIKQKISFDYLLVDSWFPCAEIMHFIKDTNHNLIGMIKMGTTKYKTSLGEISAPKIICKLEEEYRKQVKSNKIKTSSRVIKLSRKINHFYVTQDAEYDGIKVKIHFFRKKNEKWHAIISTDTDLDAIQVFKIYSRRWIIEIAHHEMKSYLNLGKSQYIDFAGQIASISVCMIQYNILCYAKRITSYETLGGLFSQLKNDTQEITLAERIWRLILEVVNKIAEFTDCDPFELTKRICSDIKALDSMRKILEFTVSSTSNKENLA